MGVKTKSPAPSVVRMPHVCTGCGLLCDDVVLELQSGAIAAILPPCPVAEDALRPRGAPPLAACTIDGAPASYDDAVAAAAETLLSARLPLVTGLHRATIEAIRAAIEIADRVRGSIDPVDPTGSSYDATAAQTVGVVTATIGEVAQRSDAIVWWFADPDATHPRLRERLSRPGERHWLAVGAAGNLPGSTPLEQIPAESAFDAAVVLRALVVGAPLDAERAAAVTGVDAAAWQALADQLSAARYAALAYDDRTLSPPAATALAELVVALHGRTRCVALPLGRPANAVGAVQTLLWQTGFPGAVSFAAGYPEYRPGEGTTAALLTSGEVDAALVVGADLLGPQNELPTAATDALRRTPLVALDDAASETMQAARVAFAVPQFETSAAGTVFRTDGIPLPLEAAIPSSLPSAAHVLRDIAERLPR